MKKGVAITLGVIIVGAIGWTGATWYTGKQIEKRSETYLARANEQISNALSPIVGLRIEQIKYDRGLFASDVRYAVSFVKTEHSPPDLPTGKIEFESRVEHGPFPAGALKRGIFLPRLAFSHTELARTDLVEPLFELTDGVSPLISDDILSYSGDVVSHAQIPPIRQTKNDIAVDFSGVQIRGTANESATVVQAEALLEKLSIESTGEDDFKVLLNELTLNVDSRQGKFDLATGESSLRVKRVEIENPAENVALSFDDFGYHVALTENETQLAADFAYDFGTITFNGTDLGNGRAVVKLAGLDGQAVKDLVNAYDRLMGQIMTGQDPDLLEDELMPVFTESGTKLLAGKPSLSIDPISWKTDKGETKFSLSLNLASPPAPEEPAEFVPEEFIIKSIDKINAEWVISKPMLEQILVQYGIDSEGLSPEEAATEAKEQVRAVAGMAEMLNLGKNEGDNIVGAFRYADGVGDLNGEEIPAEVLFGDLLSAAMDDDDYGDDAGFDTEAAEAAGLITAFPVDDFVAILEDLEYEVLERQGDEYDPVLILAPDDAGASKLTVEFICTYGTCYDLIFVAAYDTKPESLSLQAINEWNQEYRWTRAYLDDDNRAVLEMDMNAEGGIGRENVEIMIDTFISIAQDFAQYYENGGWN